MPEGPEVETVRRSLLDVVVGRRIGRVRMSGLKLRTAVSPRDFKKLEGLSITDVGRRGKLLWLRAEDDAGIFVRLGMTGRLVVDKVQARPAPHTHVRIPLAPGQEELRYVDARRFGDVAPFTSRAAFDEVMAQLGPDALALSTEELAATMKRLRNTSRSLKDALLDQRLLAGVGNIYAAEALFVARLSPFSRGLDLSAREARALLAAVGKVLRTGVENRGTSFSDYVDGRGERGRNQDHLFVFQRQGEPCRVCGSPIERSVQGQRSTFHCPRCQKPARG